MATVKKLPPGIDRLPSGRYRARFRDQYREMQAETFDRVDEAIAWREAGRTAVRRGTFVDRRDAAQPFKTFAAEWIAAHDVKETSRPNIERLIARIVEALGEDTTLEQIDQLAIKRTRVELDKRYAPGTVRVTMSYFAAIMRAAYDNGRIGRDPTVRAHSRSRRRRLDDHASGAVGPEQVPTRDEVAEIWQAAPARYRAAIACGAAGMRIGEVLGLHVEQIALDERLVTIDRQMQRIDGRLALTDPKGEKHRTIRVPGAVALELRRHIRDHTTDAGLLFGAPRSGELMERRTFYEVGWWPALVAAGLDARRFKFHGLRHFCASALLADGENPAAVAGHLGDSLMTLQRVYAHWLRDDRDVVADALESILVVSRLCHELDVTASD
ncbi:MAG TPA: tyrosine-type recombinase/integrase [Jatrophihabitantaceae bacterium]|jgi:integrase